MMIDASASLPSRDLRTDGRDEAEKPAGRPDERAIPSARLLLGQSSVTIDHDGTHYVLRATRAGKLILTK